LIWETIKCIRHWFQFHWSPKIVVVARQHIIIIMYNIIYYMVQYILCKTAAVSHSYSISAPSGADGIWFFLTIFFQNFSKKSFQSLGSDYENYLGIFQTFLILKIWDKLEVLKRFQKQFLKLDSEAKKPRALKNPKTVLD
jgi:hypothetical protein